MWYWMDMEQGQREQEQWDHLDALQKSDAENFDKYQRWKDAISERVMTRLRKIEEDEGQDDCWSSTINI